LNHFTRPINFIQSLLFLARTADPRPRLPGDVRKESPYGLGLTINTKNLSRFFLELPLFVLFPAFNLHDPVKNQRNDGFVKSSRCKARKN